MKDQKKARKGKKSSQNHTRKKEKNDHMPSEKGISLSGMIKELRQYESSFPRDPEYLQMLRDIIAGFEDEAWEPMLCALNNKKDKARKSAPWILANIDASRAAPILIPMINDDDLLEEVSDALIAIGEPIIQELIELFKHKMNNERNDVHTTMDNILLTIGKIQCEKAAEYLNDLLDEYIAVMPDKEFDPSKYEWKFRNVDFFHILEAIVRQQNKNSIEHLKEARDRFPSNYTEHLVCQIAIGRIIKHRPGEGFLPLEALDIMIPSFQIFKYIAEDTDTEKSEDWFKKVYGEYFTKDIYDSKRKDLPTQNDEDNDEENWDNFDDF